MSYLKQMNMKSYYYLSLMLCALSAGVSAQEITKSTDVESERTLSADSMEVTATTASGVAEVVSMDGTAVGDTVYVRFPA